MEAGKRKNDVEKAMEFFFFRSDLNEAKGPPSILLSC